MWPSKYLELLISWCDGLSAHKLETPETGRGGFFCPACQLVHGRSADAVYPLMAAFAATGREKYRQAAIDVFDWAERNISQPDGSWINDATGGTWKGITCFSTIALGEALRLHGDALPSGVVERWRMRLARGADFLLDFMREDTANINYPLSTAAALATAWRVLGDDQYAKRARELAWLTPKYLMPSGLIWGECPRWMSDVSARGMWPVDIPYNAGETLPNLALYAHLMDDQAMRELVARSLRAHLAFLLPDGGWDAGWSTRQYKWCYWGSRTTDGCASGLALLRDFDTGFEPAAMRNLDQMAASTHGGVLHAGQHVHAHGLRPCLHHTFVGARGLASALSASAIEDPTSPAHPLAELENEPVRYWPEVETYQVAIGPWRTSVTAYDFVYAGDNRIHPSGGALSMLWHELAGPVCVASMNEYALLEAGNMAIAPDGANTTPLTPRLEIADNGRVYSNVYDLETKLTCASDEFSTRIEARGHLRSVEGLEPDGGAKFEIVYEVSADVFTLTASVSGSPGATLILPIVSPTSELVANLDRGIRIDKPRATVRVSSGAKLAYDERRVYNHVPGVEALVVRCEVRADSQVTVLLNISPPGQRRHCRVP